MTRIERKKIKKIIENHVHIYNSWSDGFSEIGGTEAASIAIMLYISKVRELQAVERKKKQSNPNRMVKALQAIKNASGGGPARRIAIQALAGL